jgi:hypothetical protein
VLPIFSGAHAVLHVLIAGFLILNQEEMLKEATAIVAERRVPEIAALPTEAGREGVFAWAGGPPTAGQPAVLAYNKAQGPLRFAMVAGCIFVNFVDLFLK